MSTEAFAPNRGFVAPAATPDFQASIGLTASPQYLAFPSGMLAGPGSTVYVFADGGSGLAFCFSTANVPALTYSNGLPVPANSVHSFRVPQGATGISVIGQSASGTCRLVLGEGM